tara:strand:- start:1602 stop:2399 length:798 start_codon:yes stop_codon:yes gene_type:complete
MEQKKLELSNKIILLTGATGYIGTVLSYEILRSGAKLIITSRNEKNLLKFVSSLKPKYKARCKPIVADLSQDNQIETLVQKIKKKYKFINGIVNNAYSGKTGPVEQINKRDFQNAANLNLYAPLKIIKDLKNLMIKGANKSKNSSSVVNIGSMYGSVSPDKKIYKSFKDQNPVHYGSTKAGLIQMTKYLACNLDSNKIRINCVSPGPIPKNTNSSKLLKNLSKKTPMGRIGKPIEVALPVIFLLSNYSSYINGINLPIDGGWTAW